MKTTSIFLKLIRITGYCLLLFVIIPLQPQASDLSLENAVKIALENNVQLEMMEAREMSKATIPFQVGSLPDPMLSLGLLNRPVDNFSSTQEGMTQFKIGLSQGFPFPGKLGLKEESARFEAESTVKDTEEYRYHLKYQVVFTWWELFYLDRALEVIKANQNLLKQFVEIAKTKYEVGKGLQQDVLLAQVELSKLLDQEITLDRLREQRLSHFNALLNRVPTTAVTLLREIDTHSPTLLSEDQLYGIAEESRPLLKSKQEKINAANSRLELSEMGYYPDFMVGVEYGQREGENPNGSDRAGLASFKLGISLPIFTHRKQSEKIKQQRFELIMSQKAKENEEVQVRADLRSTISDYNSSISQTQLFFSGIIPQSKQTVASMMAGYRVNKVDFLNLVRMQITLFNYETQYWRMLTRSRQALARIESIIGSKALLEKSNKPSELKEIPHE